MQGLAGSVNAVASIAGLIAGGLLYDEIGTQVFLLSAVGGGGTLGLRITSPTRS